MFGKQGGTDTSISLSGSARMNEEYSKVSIGHFLDKVIVFDSVQQLYCIKEQCRTRNYHFYSFMNVILFLL